MSYTGFVVRVEKLRPHSNADRLQIATFFGSDTIVGLDTKIGDLGVYFPVDGQLSEEFCAKNDLVRRKDENGNPAGGYLDPVKRNIKAMKLRGEKSDGLYMPISAFDYLYINGAANHLSVGDKIDVLETHQICCKYIPRNSRQNRSSDKSANGNKTRKRKDPIAPLFAEHADTEQLAYNLAAFKPGDQIEISLKMHGTSQRTGYLPVLSHYERTFWDKLFKRPGKPIYEYGYVTGTRRTICGSDYDGGFYGSNEFREQHAKKFEGKLEKGETAYYEVCGWVNESTPIMPSAPNKKIGDKEFVKKYGDTTVFSYDCKPGESECYVYRMTYTSPEGFVIEYPPEFIRYRCEQMNVKCVPVLYKGFLNEPDDWYGEEWNPGNYAKLIAEEYYDGPDPIGKTHVREGVVVRIVNRPKFTAFKHKNYEFKVLSGIAVDTLADSDAADNMTEDMLSEI